MRFTKLPSIKKISFGLLALLVSLPLIYAQRSQPSDRSDRSERGGERSAPAARSEPAPRVEPVRAPMEHALASVDRSNHGSIRHFDTHVVERPLVEHREIDVHHEVDMHRGIIAHHDVDVDFHQPRYWHGFAFGARFHTLRGGGLRIFVGNAPYFYDDGIFYQQIGDDYQTVYPPVGAIVPRLPDGAFEVYAGNIAYYYAGGAFYVQQSGGFVIAPPPMRVVVPELPPGAVQVSVNNRLAYQFNGIYYEPVFVNGVTQYMTFMS